MSFNAGNNLDPAIAVDGIIGKGQLANNETISATRLLTNADRRVQVLTASGAIRIVQLPTTSIVAGEAWDIMCGSTSGFGLTIQSSNGTTISTLNPGESLRYVTRVATPVASTDWSVLTPSLSISNGTVTVPALRFTGSSVDTGFYSPGADQIALSSNGVQTWLVDATGAHTFGPAGFTGTHFSNGFLLTGQGRKVSLYCQDAADGIFTISLNQTFAESIGTTIARQGGNYRIESRDDVGFPLHGWYARAPGSALTTNTLIGSAAASGVWTFGPAVTDNYTGVRHRINGFIYGGNATSVDSSSQVGFGSNVHFGAQAAQAGRTNTTTGGTGILFENRTTNSGQAIGVYANQINNSLTTNALLIATANQTGAWTFGPATGAIGHLFNGEINSRYVNTGGDGRTFMCNSAAEKSIGAVGGSIGDFETRRANPTGMVIVHNVTQSRTDILLLNGAAGSVVVVSSQITGPGVSYSLVSGAGTNSVLRYTTVGNGTVGVRVTFLIAD